MKIAKIALAVRQFVSYPSGIAFDTARQEPGMLREIKDVVQKPGELRRRWYSSSSMDLFVWINDDNEVVSYQFTYHKPHAEKALTWKEEEGFLHLGVDDGSRPGKHPGSPLLKKNGKFNPAKIVSLLKNKSGELEPSIKDFIVSGIENHFK